MVKGKKREKGLIFIFNFVKQNLKSLEDRNDHILRRDVVIYKSPKRWSVSVPRAQVRSKVIVRCV